MTNTEIPNKNPDKESTLNRSKTNGENKSNTRSTNGGELGDLF